MVCLRFAFGVRNRRKRQGMKEYEVWMMKESEIGLRGLKEAEVGLQGMKET